MENDKTTTTSVVIGSLLLLLIAAYATWQTLFRKAPQGFVQVAENGRTTAAPDTASITVGMRSESVGDTQLPARQKADAEKFQAIVAAMQSVAPDAKIETRTFSVNPNYDLKTGKKTDYTIYNSADVQLRGDAAKLPQLYAAVQVAIERGSNSVGNIDYSLSVEQQNKLVLAAQRDAMHLAFTKASDVADAAGLTLGKAFEIVENGQSQYGSSRAGLQSVAVLPNSSEAKFDAGRFVPPEEIEVYSNILVKYAL